VKISVALRFMAKAFLTVTFICFGFSILERDAPSHNSARHLYQFPAIELQDQRAFGRLPSALRTCEKWECEQEKRKNLKVFSRHFADRIRTGERKTSAVQRGR
jgi:hypothetical protein